MIDTAQSRAAIEAMQTEHVIVPKAQPSQMCDETDLGNQARRVVSSIRATFALTSASTGYSATDERRTSGGTPPARAWHARTRPRWTEVHAGDVLASLE